MIWGLVVQWRMEIFTCLPNTCPRCLTLPWNPKMSLTSTGWLPHTTTAQLSFATLSAVAKEAILFSILGQQPLTMTQNSLSWVWELTAKRLIQKGGDKASGANRTTWYSLCGQGGYLELENWLKLLKNDRSKYIWQLVDAVQQGKPLI